MKRWQLAVSLAVLAADQATKVWALKLTAVFPLLPGIAQARHTENTGVSFSLLSDAPWLTVALTLALLALALLLLRGREGDAAGRLGIGLAFGGALGNLTDRLLRGSVTDFIELLFVRFAVFNVADAALVVGIALVALSLLLRPDAWNPREAKPEDQQHG